VTSDTIDKALKALASARLLLGAGDSDGATNRAYCAMFDGAIASLRWAGSPQVLPRTHSGLPNLGREEPSNVPGRTKERGESAAPHAPLPAVRPEGLAPSPYRP
jgi:hypothetical protein